MSDPKTDESVPLSVARRLARGWAWNDTRKSWWRWSGRDEMNVRYPLYEKATDVEAEAMPRVLSGGDAAGPSGE